MTAYTRSLQSISFLFSPEVPSPAHRVFEGRLPGGRAGYRADLERAGGRAFPLWLAISPYQLHTVSLCMLMSLRLGRSQERLRLLAAAFKGPDAGLAVP